MTTAAAAAAAELIAARGGGVIIGTSDAGLLARLYDDLCRLGDAYIHDPGADLSEELTQTMNLLVDGATLAEVASVMHWSQRTASRRVAAARSALGVRTTTEAVAYWRVTIR